jgi:hypothetical protein
LENLTPSRRRYFLLVAGAAEWVDEPRRVSTIDSVDSDGDDRISATEYSKWVEGVIAARRSLPFKTAVLVAIYAGAPFIAFGFLDNALMILTGDAINDAFGASMNFSQMQSAALGGICSGTLGIQLHGVAERLVQHFMREPPVSSVEKSSRSYFRACHIGGTLGIMVGLCLGMSLLLVVN